MKSINIDFERDCALEVRNNAITHIVTKILHYRFRFKIDKKVIMSYTCPIIGETAISIDGILSIKMDKLLAVISLLEKY